ncbi:acetyl-CoA C-acyltransferase [Flavisolibacter ginsenosidimutans]|uniref:Acetyl-CoA C-acyltransferase n=1 Tax=Flavisolibacter ginsenosidimutans TaxID=661481 RepID=A0A5B8UIQ5_9BACT|nr:acetyl-CoA C-acyltransferase [Flavisolibacter ginsenosidimutans]QEC56557.1 acetyl-CoA C-acyltransferase [Flavisolibacter ginsenosidimutans]
MKNVYVIDAIRTPLGKYGGALATVRPDDLLAHVIKELLDRNPSVDPSSIEDVIAGDANQAGEDNRNVARMAALLAGLPVTVPGNTVNRLCASGLQAIMDASRQIECGDAELMIACGVESMSRAPFVMPKATTPFQRTTEVYDTTLGWRFVNNKLADVYYPYSMGETAENVARQWNVSRGAQDEWALSSQEKYFAALEKGIWKEEIVPVEIPAEKGTTKLFDSDEHPRKTSLEKLASLKPAFVKDGTVTAGNAAGINDGAAAMLLASESAVKKFGLKPVAKVIASAVAGVDPSIMGIGPVPATQKALKRASLSVADMDLIELNEAFASQVLACIQDLGLDKSKINVNGGSIALGHPLGCSGVRLSTTLVHEMKRRGSKYGLATMCVGVGQGASIIFEGIV